MILPFSVRWYSSKISLRKGLVLGKKPLFKKPTNLVHPNTPARTRFAPSPTGYLHLGSLRTALYNYLLAKNTGGQFILRLEDTDRTRLVEDAEQNIYDSLKWTGLKIDEGPQEGGPYGPYRQSDRIEIYKKYVQILLDKGLAYHCNCSKDRLLNLRESALKLKPPTNVTYDRKCFHEPTPANENSVIRFKSPDVYDDFTDLVHGKLNFQPQYNNVDRRYDDIVIMKSDGLPTYHFANVVDDHLMKITHVIRGEEWLPSTPKHIALYKAFGWEPPAFVHIPLLTSLEDKKLSKRSGDIGVLSLKTKGILPESLINFVALFGWSPPRNIPGVTVGETMTLDQIASKFSLDHLTKGNAKVSDSKLNFFNKFHLNEKLNSPKSLNNLVDEYYPRFSELTELKYDKEYFKQLLTLVGPSLSTLNEIETVHSYIFSDIDYVKVKPAKENYNQIFKIFDTLPFQPFEDNVNEALNQLPNESKKDIYHAIRWALSGDVPGIAIPLLLQIFGEAEYRKRLQAAINYTA